METNDMIYQRVAGMDVSKRDVKVYIRVPSVQRNRYRSRVSTWGAMVPDIMKLKEFLEAVHLELVVMESTSDYWKPFFYLLEETVPVQLVNARQAKNLPGHKTDARDAAIIAEAARSLPHTLRSIVVADEQAAELSMLCGFDDDLAKQATAASNQIRGLLTQIHPALERVIGPHLDHPAMPELLIKYPSPEKLRKAGQARVATLLAKHAPRAGKRWTAEIFTALGKQSVVVSGTGAAGMVLAQLAVMLKLLRVPGMSS